MKKQIRLNAFAMNCVAHQSPGLWTHPRDRTAEYNRLPYWIDLAKTLERGRFDGLFLADVLGVYDVYGTSPDAEYLSDNPNRRCPDISKARQLLGYAPSIDVHDGVRRYLSFLAEKSA